MRTFFTAAALFGTVCLIGASDAALAQNRQAPADPAPREAPQSLVVEETRTQVTAVTVRYSGPDGVTHVGCHNRQTQTSEPGPCPTKDPGQ